MSKFASIKTAVDAQIQKILSYGKSSQDVKVFKMNVDNDTLWDLYLETLPQEENGIFRERRTYDCNCCKNFIRRVGGVVAINVKTQEVVTAWDVEVPYPFDEVVVKMSEYVKSQRIAYPFMISEKVAGSVSTPDNLIPGHYWDHFHTEIPSVFVNFSVNREIGSLTSNKTVLMNSIDQISLDSVDTVLDLIEDNNLYRGEEFTGILRAFRLVLLELDRALEDDLDIDTWAWIKSLEVGQAVCSTKNTVIGTILTDITEGVELEIAVNKYESKVAGDNYRRPKALATKKQIEEAKKFLTENGMIDSLPRRHATTKDISINDVLFVDRSVKKELDVFDTISQKVETKDIDKTLNRATDITLEDFENKVLSKAMGIELFMTSSLKKNLVTLVAPVNAEAPCMLSWGNNFTWSYNGGVADSIDQRVKSAGGQIDAHTRFSLSWDGKDDLDLSVRNVATDEMVHYPHGYRRGFGAHLDVDANGCDGYMADPVENIYWDQEPCAVKYEVVVHNYSRRDGNDGYQLKFVCGDDEITFTRNKELGNSKKDKFFFEYLGNGEYNIKEPKDVSASGSSIKEDVWGIQTGGFVPVTISMWSPNHWEGTSQSGNKHLFFMLQNCKNPDSVRGFYNEQLHSDLKPMRKTMEMLASSMKVEYSDDQLSGVGFSSTKRAEVQLRVSTDKGPRIYNLKF